MKKIFVIKWTDEINGNVLYYPKKGIDGWSETLYSAYKFLNKPLESEINPIGTSGKGFYSIEKYYINE